MFFLTISPWKSRLMSKPQTVARYERQQKSPGWLPTLAYRLLGKTHLDGVIWDAMMSLPGDWRIFEHTDPAMFAMMRKVMADNGNIDEKTRIWFDHRARTLWPLDPAEQEKIARRENVELAHEGEAAYLPR